jgi:serine/threonine protein kinase
MLFELITGDFLFEPRTGKDFDKDDDHLAQMVETLGFFPKSFALSGVNSKKYFNTKGELRRIKQLRIWPLKNVLLEKYRLKEEEASLLTSFLLPMLVYEPEKRATAEEMIEHPWLKMKNEYCTKMTEKEFWEMSLVQKQREVENNERLKRGESPILDGVRMPSSNDNTDVEDNLDVSVESEFNFSENEKEFVENLEYHHLMNQIKQKILANHND